MSNVIRFMETMGQDAGLRHASRSALYDALNEQSVEVDARWAILCGDEKRIEALLDTPLITCCGFAPAKEPDDDAEEEPSRDDDEIRAHATCGVAAAA